MHFAGKKGRDELKKNVPLGTPLMVWGKLKIYKGSFSRAFILYSKKEGIGYLSLLGEVDEGSDFFLSETGCLVVIIGIAGLPAPIGFRAAVAVEKLIFCIGRNFRKVLQSISSKAYNAFSVFNY